MRIIAFLSLLAGCTGKSSEPPDGGGMDSGTDCHDCDTEEALDVVGCAGTVGQSFPCEGHCHVDDASTLSWLNDPPHSGDHLPVWEREPGEHGPQATPPSDPVARANWVHNLEHGFIVLLFNCPGGCDAELDVLRQVLVQRPDTPILLTPDELMGPPRFAAVSWTWVYETDALDLATLLCFVDQHACQAPEGPRIYGDECLM